MLTLARYTLKGPYQAAGVVGLLAMLGVFIVPLAGMSIATVALTLAANVCAVILVGLIILTQGPGPGLKVIAGSALVALLAAWLVLNSIEPGISMVVQHWLPVVFLAMVLRSSKSLAIAVFAGIGMGIVVILLQSLYWSELESLIRAQLVPGQAGIELNDQQKEHIALLARVFMLFYAAGLYLMSMLMLFAARWMQARLADSQGFRREFCSLSLGKPAALFAVSTLLLGFWLPQYWIWSFAMVLLVAFLFQGVAVVHSKLSGKKQGFALLLLYYLLLVFTMQITGILTSITGIIDNWLGFRGKPQSPAA